MYCVLANMSFKRSHHQLSIDLYGPLPTGKRGMKYLFVTVDTFSKFVRICLIRKATTNAITKCLFDHDIPEYGKPDRIQTDHKTQFTSMQWTIKLNENKVKHILSPIRRPHGNMVERVNKEIGLCLRTFCHDKHKGWVDYIPMFNTFLNEIPHETTGLHPQNYT